MLRSIVVSKTDHDWQAILFRWILAVFIAGIALLCLIGCTTSRGGRCKAMIGSPPRIWPTGAATCVINSPFGYRIDPHTGRKRHHNGIDIRAKNKEPVVATGDGVVRFADSCGSYGKLVVIDHGGGIETRYGHFSRILVKRGQCVHLGEVIGRAGASGNATGPHIHYEVRIAGQPVDPCAYLLKRGPPDLLVAEGPS